MQFEKEPKQTYNKVRLWSSTLFSSLLARHLKKNMLFIFFLSWATWKSLTGHIWSPGLSLLMPVLVCTTIRVLRFAQSFAGGYFQTNQPVWVSPTRPVLQQRSASLTGNSARTKMFLLMSLCFDLRSRLFDGWEQNNEPPLSNPQQKTTLSFFLFSFFVSFFLLYNGTQWETQKTGSGWEITLHFLLHSPLAPVVWHKTCLWSR